MSGASNCRDVGSDFCEMKKHGLFAIALALLEINCAFQNWVRC